MSKPTHLGFPYPLLGMESMRLPILFDDGDRIVIEKPQGVLVQQDGWYPRLPVLVEAIRYQAAVGKPDLGKLGIGEDGLWAVTDLDPECHGPVLFARTREAADELRNALGSGSFTFIFQLLAEAGQETESRECDLPLARHGRLPRMLVSHTTGKKASTVFHAAGRAGRYTCFEARTAFPRRHQILLHAAESGLPVLGDRLYARSHPLLLSRFKRDYRPRKDREERPLYDGPAYFLRELDLGEGARIEAPFPPKWEALVKQLVKYSR